MKTGIRRRRGPARASGDWRPVRLAAAGWLVSIALVAIATSAPAVGYVNTMLVSDIPGLAQFTDPNLVNPWGMSHGPTSPFWVSDNKTGKATIYDGTGQALPLVVTIPPPPGGTSPSAPTGQVFNGTPGFTGDRFIFATEEGTISGWQPSLGSNAAVRVDNSATGSDYRGLAAANNGQDLLYAADFANNRIDVFDPDYNPVFMPGSFTDPNLPSGYAPFNIQNIGGDLYVTYALRDPNTGDDVPGAGHGFVDRFDANGALQQRAILQDGLNSPWGMALAPDQFGEFSGDLLVGNFGDGRINAYNPVDFSLQGNLEDTQGNPIVIDGLWGLMFGNGAAAGPVNSLYYTAGIPGPGGQPEDHGLFGAIRPVPEPASVGLFGAGMVALALWRAARRRPSARRAWRRAGARRG